MLQSFRNPGFFFGTLLIALAGCQPDFSLLPEKQPTTEPAKQSPATYRIKRIVYEGFWAIAATTEFEYASGLKLVKARYVGHDFGQGPPVGTFAYNADNQLVSYEYAYPKPTSTGTTGERTTFGYAGSDQVNAQTDFVGPGSVYTLLKRVGTSLEPDGSMLATTEEPGSKYIKRSERYKLTGGSLTEVTTVNVPTSSEIYTFDDKPSPFYGLYGPDITPVRRYSRNNVTGATIVQPDGTVQTYAIEYTYNANGLPATAKTGSSTIRFEYETY